MSRLIGVLTLVAGGLFAAGCSSSSTNDGGPDAGSDGGPCVFVAGQTTEAQIAAAFNTATDGTTLNFCAGTFTFTNTLTIAAKNVTVTGAGAAATILDFSGQTAGSDGIDGLAGSDGLVFTGFAIRDTKGNGIRVDQSTGVTFDGVTISWTAAAANTHGPYGIYPVTDKNVLVENCTISGASDTGVYVGQSDGIIVQNNVAFQNVAGIEIENSFNADVHDNNSHDNTAGILVFDLPGEVQQGGHNVRVFNNMILHNNTPNFAVNGDIVSQVPAGTGCFVMANHDVEVFGNTIQQNNTIGFAAISYLILSLPLGDGGYYPYPYQVYAHDNIDPCDGSAQSNGTSPDTSNQFGILLLTAEGLFTPNAIPSLTWDGIADPTVDAGLGNPNPMQICFQNNNVGAIVATDGGYTGFADLNFLQFDQNANSGTGNLPEILTQNLTDFTCTGVVLPPISF